MDRRQTIQKFYTSLESCNSEEILKFFTSEALVHTPLRKSGLASTYYPELLSNTKSFKADIKEFFQGMDNQDHLLISVSFRWELPDGIVNIQQSTALFEFEPNSDKIAVFTAIYDFAEFKQALQSAVHI